MKLVIPSHSKRDGITHLGGKHRDSNAIKGLMAILIRISLQQPPDSDAHPSIPEYNYSDQKHGHSRSENDVRCV